MTTRPGLAAAAAVAGLALGLALPACRLEVPWAARRLTGTCAGACDHYLRCARDDRPAARAACLAECPEVLQDPDALRAFESLRCPDAVRFVEGASGRGPSG